ncbi:MAG: 50S ribosomal protein L10 [Candidatus Saelkia tenebricola]|nr:50S ribosomal protein L10 [Candidatus Saelkia tenebricola]
MKVGHFTRELMVQEYTNRMQTAGFLFFTNFKGINADNMRLIRNKLKQASSGVIVVRNSLIRRMFEDLEMKKVLNYVDGELAIVYGMDDPINITKQLQELSKSVEGFVVRGGLIEDKVLDSNDVKKLASIPSKEVLLAQVVNLLKSPISNLIFVLRGNIQSLVSIIKQIKEKKES